MMASSNNNDMPTNQDPSDLAKVLSENLLDKSADPTVVLEDFKSKELQKQ